MNAPNPEDAVILDDDEVKTTIHKDLKIKSASNFVFRKEDHTLGNLLTKSLLENRKVRYAGYKMPHPLENVMIVRLQTNGDADCKEVMLNTLDALKTEFETLESQFLKAIEGGGADADLMRL